MNETASTRAPRVVAQQIPDGLTEELLAELSVNSAHIRASRSSTPNTNGNHHGAAQPASSSSAPLTNGTGSIPSKQFRLIPDFSDLAKGEEGDDIGSPPHNELLTLYRQATTPAEGLANVAKYVGEFMALLRLDIEVSGFFVAPVTGTEGRAVKCSDHWFLGAPLKARRGFVHPVGGSWQVPNKPIIDATAPEEWDDDSPTDGSVELDGNQHADTSKFNGPPSNIANGILAEEDDEDLVIHYDDAPVTRALGRAFKDSEVLQAREDIRRIQEHPGTAASEIEKMDWHVRKRTCHLHIIAFLYPFIGNSNFREIPLLLREKQLRIHGWPTSCVVGPQANIGRYNADHIREMLFAIWRGKMTVKPWKDQEKQLVFQDPAIVVNIPLIIDSAGKELRFGTNLDPDQLRDASEVGDTPGPSDREGSLDLRRTMARKKVGRGRPRKVPLSTVPTPSPAPMFETSQSATPAPSEPPAAKRRGRPPKYQRSFQKVKEFDPPATAAKAVPSVVAHPSTSAPISSGARISQPGVVDFHRYVEDPRRENKRFYSDEQIKQAQQTIQERKRDLAHGREWIESFDWNTRRKMCRLHLNAFLYDELGNTEFHEILERLHRKRLRLVGWPAVCELPGGQHVGNWNKIQVESLFFAIWDGTLYFEKWERHEQAKNYPFLIQDTSGNLHRPKPEQVDIRRDHEPGSMTYGLPLDGPVDVRKMYLSQLAKTSGKTTEDIKVQVNGKGKERAVESDFDDEGDPTELSEFQDGSATPESGLGRRTHGLTAQNEQARERPPPLRLVWERKRGMQEDSESTVGGKRAKFE